MLIYKKKFRIICRSIIGLFLSTSAVLAQQSGRLDLGKLENGESLSFVKTNEDLWGIEISGGTTPYIHQPKPARLEIYRSEKDIRRFSTGYKIVTQTDTGINAIAEITYGKNVVFHIKDFWSINGPVVLVNRKIEVKGSASGGFNSSLVLSVDESVSWSDVNCLAPGALYGDPTFDGERSPGGTMNYESRRFMMREDILPAPLFALSFSNGTSVAVLNPDPRGETTVDETRLSKDVMTDARYLFGSLGAWENDKNIELGYVFPGTTYIYPRDINSSAQPRWIRRYHPISEGIDHSYRVSFRFGSNETFRAVTKDTWRWAWNTLNPEVYPIDVEQMRRVLTDHLVSQAVTIEGRTAIPFVISTMDTAKHRQWNWTMSAMGFVGKTIECADQLLRESDRDTTERGQNMRRVGLSIISSMIKSLDTVPLQGTGYDFATGKAWDHHWLAPWLRNATEDMRVLVRAYRRERDFGREHPEWFTWVKTYVDWLLLQQREDGSFPRRWKAGSNEVAEPTGTTSYCPVPLLVMMTEETGDPRYQLAAIRAAEYVWTSWGSRGLFIGGASDNPNITDKEAGMLSMEAFLSLYESTKDTIWLERAQSAGDFAESWIWIWNVPMPLDADDNLLHWKKGVPTIGLQGITALGPGGVDEYLDWAVPSYAKLYKYTNDQHYLDVARILLHNTKSMVALPGRQYDLKGIGWQQEHWRMGPGGPGRGVGGHRFWLPWVSANHLYGITGLEEFDPELYRQLSKIVNIEVDANQGTGELKPIWAWFGYDEPNYTYMKDGKKLLNELATLSPVPVYIRVHNLMTTGDGSPALKWGSTNMYTEDRKGNPIYNWQIVDSIFDTFIRLKMKPLAQIGFMPEALSSKPQPYKHNWSAADKNSVLFTGWAYPPNDYLKWAELIYQWVKHCIERYGKAEVETWYWELWNEPNIAYLQAEDQMNTYIKMYDYASDAVKRALPSARFGGPHITGIANDFLKGFLNHCLHGNNEATGKAGAPLDFIAFHAKGSPQATHGIVYMGIQNQLKAVHENLKIISSMPEVKNLPVIIGESDPEGCAACGMNTHPANAYRNGTMYSSYTAASLARIYDINDFFGTHLIGAVNWSFEFENQPWFYGFRDLATNGVDKPVLNVFRMLGMMQGNRLMVTGGTEEYNFKSICESGVRGTRADINALASGATNSVAVLLWNYHDKDVRDGGSQVNLTIRNIHATTAVLYHYRIDSKHSNSYEVWKKMGSPQNPSPDQIKELEKSGQLEMLHEPMPVNIYNNQYKIEMQLPGQAVSLIRLSFQ